MPGNWHGVQRFRRFAWELGESTSDTTGHGLVHRSIGQRATNRNDDAYPVAAIFVVSGCHKCDPDAVRRLSGEQDRHHQYHAGGPDSDGDRWLLTRANTDQRQNKQRSSRLTQIRGRMSRTASTSRLSRRPVTLLR